MGFIQQIIDFILGLLGMKKTEQGLPSGQSGAYTDAQRQQIRNNAVQGLEHVQGAENIHVFGTGEGSRIVRSEKGADLVEEDGEQQWVERIDTDIPRAQWVDEWGPLNTQAPTLLEEFVYHESTFDQTRSGDPLSAEQKLKGFGYHSVGHYYYVRNTILKHFGTPTGPNLCDSVFQSQEFSNAVMKAHARMRGDEQSAALSANPELLAPVEGVTLEIYANLCARMAQGMQQPELLVLARAARPRHGRLGARERGVDRPYVEGHLGYDHDRVQQRLHVVRPRSVRGRCGRCRADRLERLRGRWARAHFLREERRDRGRDGRVVEAG
jgi:hypothetical protein